jgi:hypothetical protein
MRDAELWLRGNNSGERCDSAREGKSTRRKTRRLGLEIRLWHADLWKEKIKGPETPRGCK